MTGYTEQAVTIACQGSRLAGILHAVDANARIGVVIAVGGPQYRAGSHRQFTLMARSLAGAGFPVLRFDYRGMGDAEGEPRSFDSVSEDIGAAVNRLFKLADGLQRVVIFGLCDAASATAIYAPGDDRVSGIVLANPWVRSEVTEAKAYLRHYYVQRLLSLSFLRKVWSGKFDARQSLRGLWQSINAAGKSTNGKRQNSSVGTPPFVDRMLPGLQCRNVDVLILLSEHDLTAREFSDLCRADREWRAATRKKHVSVRTLTGADHTLSRRADLDAACTIVADWLSART